MACRVKRHIPHASATKKDSVILSILCVCVYASAAVCTLHAHLHGLKCTGALALAILTVFSLVKAIY